MAIKGKSKKSKQGGARRRPAAAPRPTIGASRRKPPWYKTPAGRVLGAIAALVVIGTSWALIANARDNAHDLAVRQDAIETYTGGVRSALQTLREPLSELSAAVQSTDIKGSELEETANQISAALQEGAAQIAAVQIPRAQTSGTALLQSVGLYQEAASLLADAAKLSGEDRGRILSHVTAITASGDSAWLVGVTALDEVRRELDLGASEIGAPSAPAPAPLPSPPDEGRGNRGGKGQSSDTDESGKPGSKKKKKGAGG